ncbi:MAG TPA: ribonuclease HI family protein [Candidatus Paceibacterota bacterium]|nr:ribonuclease HI family protein [Candidatus Paceibacterota bacterium]
MKYKFLIHTDGGARGNPGPAAAGVVIEGDPVGHKEYGEYLGEVTNNEAEYRAVILALKKLKHLIGSEKAKDSSVEIHVDSELLERQLNGEYKIKDENIKNFFVEIWNLKTDFGEVIFKHIRREENVEADRIVNQILDREVGKLKL